MLKWDREVSKFLIKSTTLPLEAFVERYGDVDFQWTPDELGYVSVLATAFLQD